MVEPRVMQVAGRNTSQVEEEKREIVAEDPSPPAEVLARLNFFYKQNQEMS